MQQTLCFCIINIIVLLLKEGNHAYAAQCRKAEQVCGTGPMTCDANSRYRSYDGSCNNLKNPLWGTTESPYGYLLKNNYQDGIDSWPTASDGSPLPNARTVSLEIFGPKYAVEEKWNLNTQQWGQVIAHDMSLTEGPTETHMSSPVCCTFKGQFAPDANENPLCRPIIVPDIDVAHKSRGWKCLNFLRAISTKDKGCTKPKAPALPVSAVTPLMDLSLTYGSTDEQAASLRKGKGGLLLTEKRNGYTWPPQAQNAEELCEGVSSPNETCFNFGDERGNQSPQLTILQIVLLKEHNRVAKALGKINPQWNDETIFQEARRICIAEIQYINYYEYLLALLGKENMIKNELIRLDTKNYVNDYDCKVNPVVLKEHATGAYRHFHTLIRGYLDLVTEKRIITSNVRLSDWFNKPSLLDDDDTYDKLTRGLTYQAADKSDQYFDLEVTKYLFKGNQSIGSDLRATDIQRGRDHGVATYVQLRGYCGLSEPKTFDDFKSDMSAENVALLKSLYKSPQDIDLVVGGSLEYHASGALVGPTFLCILLTQFRITRISDRFFFENGSDKNIAFTLPQLNAIRKGSSMARLLCDNSRNVKSMQRKAFQQISPENPLVPCKDLPSVDLSLWAEKPSTSKNPSKN